MSEGARNSARRMGTGILLGVVFIAIAAISPYVFDLVVSTAPDTPTRTLAEQIGAPPTPAQEIPAQVALEELRGRDRDRSTTYGWVDKDAGVVRVPVDRARQFVLEKGLPSR